MSTYFANVTLFDGRVLRPRAGVLVWEGAIEWVGPHRRAPRKARAAEEVDGAGRTLTPGLIDTHVHLTFDGEHDFVTEARDLTPAVAALKAVRNLGRQLQRGVTTVRDLGAIDAVPCEVGAAVVSGLAAGPRVLAVGQALTIVGGHGKGTFAREVSGAEEVRRAIREQMKAGARSVKVIATGGVLTPGVSVDFTAMTEDELDAAVDEAHSWGYPIAAHAIGTAGIERAVRAGVDSIEHGSLITTPLARLMAERGTFHVPTISAPVGILSRADDLPDYIIEKARSIAARARDSFRRTIRAGVRHACGTDSGTPGNPHGSAPLEVARMVEWGMTPLKALEAATAEAAELLRVDEVTGTVAPGKAADLCLYEGSPLEDPSVLLTPERVMLGGEWASPGPGTEPVR